MSFFALCYFKMELVAGSGNMAVAIFSCIAFDFRRKIVRCRKLLFRPTIVRYKPLANKSMYQTQQLVRSAIFVV